VIGAIEKAAPPKAAGDVKDAAAEAAKEDVVDFGERTFANPFLFTQVAVWRGKGGLFVIVAASSSATVAGSLRAGFLVLGVSAGEDCRDDCLGVGSGEGEMEADMPGETPGEEGGGGTDADILCTELW